MLYHQIDDTGEGASIIAEETFLAHLDCLQEEGYITITLRQMLDYVEQGKELPPKPVMITFDDGYLSNYTIAWPALKERGMTATFFAIGCSVGKDTYKQTGLPMMPHFSYEQAQEMIDSQVVSVQSHTYDMHQYGPYEPKGGRKGVYPLEHEGIFDYQQALYHDFSTSVTQLEENTTEQVLALAYPMGLYTQASEQACDQLGIPITLTTQGMPARIEQGNPGSLRLLGRYSIDDCTPQQLLELIQQQEKGV